jgi:hypothetical protein
VTAAYVTKQNNYASMLLDIAKNRFNSGFVSEIDPVDETTHRSVIGLWNINNTENLQDVYNFIFPNGYNVADAINGAVILATLNVNVDEWNLCIQGLNTQPEVSSLSDDKFADIDDENGHLASSITMESLHRLSKVDVPPHSLVLKVNDICFLTHSISKKEKLAKNSRVRIVSISRYMIRICSLETNPTYHSIPRVRFRFKLPYYASFYMLRTQFPLRLAYAMTIDKSQGQSMNKVIIDIRNSSFSHGQSYVAFSRVRDANNVLLFCQSDQKDGSCLHIQNVVYPMLCNIPFS